MQSNYEMAEVLELNTPEQFKALGDPFRQKILELLMEQPATTIQLATALDCPTSTMAHHLHVLNEANLIKVVSTRQVRALTERYYGRTAHTFISISHEHDSNKALGLQMLQQIYKEIAASPYDDRFLSCIFSYARIPESQVHAFVKRVDQLAQEFDAMRVPGEQAYGFSAAIYRTDLPELPISDEYGA